MVTRGEFIQERVQSLSNRVAADIMVSHITVLPGPVPSPNPPTALVPVIQNSAVQGATSVNIKCLTASGRLVVDDQFTVSGITGTYRVTAPNASSMDLFTGVTFAPGLSAAVAAGNGVTFNFINQQLIKAYLNGSTKSLVENGTITTILRLTIPAKNLTFIPNVGDRVVLNNTNYLVGSSVPIFAWGQVAAYELMVK